MLKNDLLMSEEKNKNEINSLTNKNIKKTELIEKYKKDLNIITESLQSTSNAKLQLINNHENIVKELTLKLNEIETKNKNIIFENELITNVQNK
jgi:hypothetical protein